MTRTLTGAEMLHYSGWTEAADHVIKGILGAITAKTVTYDFERLMEGPTLLKCSEFGHAIVKIMAQACLSSHRLTPSLRRDL